MNLTLFASGLLWGAGFVASILLMLVFSDEPVRNAQGELTSTSPAWMFPVVWTPNLKPGSECNFTNS